jgi:N-formylglutamate amidohydrolase
MVDPSVHDNAPYTLIGPDRPAVPFVFNVPHAGRYYPPDLLADTELDLADLRAMEDCLMDELVRPAVAHLAPVLINRYARAYVDTNRDHRELDARIISAKLPDSRHTLSERVRAGLGVIPAIAGGGRPIYQRPLPWHRVESRLNRIYHPTHAALMALVRQTLATFGCAVLVDCHSMPRLPHGLHHMGRSPDVVIGDRHGRSAGSHVVGAAVAAFKAQGLTVARNSPYAGGYNAEAYGAPASGVHALQIEISRDLYLNERSLTLHEGAGHMTRTLQAVFDRLYALPLDALRPPALPTAAE